MKERILKILYRLCEWHPWVKKLQDEHLAILSGTITVDELIIRNGTITAAFGTEMAKHIARGFGMMLREAGATNYAEMQFRSDAFGGETLCVTVKWYEGKTPHELRKKAEQELADLKASLAIPTDKD